MEEVESSNLSRFTNSFLQKNQSAEPEVCPRPGIRALRQTRENRRTLNLHRLQSVRIQAENCQNRRCDLSRLYEAADRPCREIRSVARQAIAPDGQHPSIDGRRIGTAAVDLRLVPFHAFLIFRLRSVVLVRLADSSCQSVACGDAGRRENAILCHIAIGPTVLGVPPVTRAIRPGKESDGREVVVRVWFTPVVPSLAMFGHVMFFAHIA